MPRCDRRALPRMVPIGYNVNGFSANLKEVGMKLQVLPGRYAVCRLDPDAVQPIWARSPAGACLLSVTWSDSELSVVCPEERVPTGMPAERGFAALKVRGPLDLTLTGVLASLTGPLSEEGVPVLAISTHDTDYLLLHGEDVGRGTAALAAAGHSVGSATDGEEPVQVTGTGSQPVPAPVPPAAR